MELPPGSVVERYVVERVLGAGAMAVVYGVRHRQLGSRHALKLLRVGGPGLRARLVQEGRAQARLRHPNVVPVTDVVDHEGQPGLVMDLVDGPTLDAWSARHRPTLAQLDALADGLLAGLGAAHREGLVHRDLKPANILLARDGRRLLPRIADFGLARVLGDDGLSPLATRAGTVMGTPPYMAPEQIRDASAVDARADLFSMGAVLYELATGARAFGGDDVATIFDRVRAGAYRPPRELRPDLPDRVVDAIAAALAGDRDRRVPTAEALRARWSGAAADAAWDDAALDAAAGETAGPETSDAHETSDFAGSSPGATLGSFASLGPAPTADTRGSFGPDAEAAPAVGLPVPPPAAASAASAPSAEPVPAPPAAPAVPAPRRGRALGAATGLAAALLLALGAWLVRGATSEVFAADRVPTVSADPAVQARAEEAFRAYLDADVTTAHRLAAQVAEAAPTSPEAQVLALHAALADLDGLDAARAMARLEASEAGHPAAASARALRVLRVSNDQAGLARACAEHLARWPDDLLATFACAPASEAPLEERLAALDRLHAALPRPLVRAAAVDLAASADAGARALALAEAALVEHPDVAGLVYRRARARIRVGDRAGAEADLRRALALDPAFALAGIELAQLLVGAGERERVAPLDAWLLSDLTPPAHRQLYATRIAYSFLELGRNGDTVRYDELAAAIAEERGDFDAMGEVLSYAFYAALPLGDPARVSALLERARRAYGAPELAPGLREAAVGRLLLMDGVAAARRGDVATAVRLRERLVGRPEIGAHHRGQLGAEIAAARRDPDAVVAAVREQGGNACDVASRTAFHLGRAGAWERAAASAREFLAADCTWSQSRMRTATAHAWLARVALAGGDREAAARELAAYREAWPDPDPANEVVAVAEAVAAALAGPAAGAAAPGVRPE